MSKRYYIFSILIAVSLILAACGGGAAAPEQCAENPDENSLRSYRRRQHH